MAFCLAIPLMIDLIECLTLRLTSSLRLVSASTLEAEASQATTSFTAAMEVSQVEGKIISEQGASSDIQKAHPP
jgi:hypothetical protein